jgi:hypothetical protein
VQSWTAEAGSLRCDAEAFYDAYDIHVEVCGTVKDQVTGYRVVRECLSQVLRYPAAYWVPGYIEMQDAASVVRDDKEAIKHAKGYRWNGEEVHRRDGFAVVVCAFFRSLLIALSY